MTDATHTAAAPVSVVHRGSALLALFRADATIAVKNRRAAVLSLLLPFVVLFSTHGAKATARLGGSLFVIGLAISYGLAANGLLGYAMTVARDRDQGVFQRLRVTPVPTWAIMGSRIVVQLVTDLVIAIVVLVIGSRVHHVPVSVTTYALVLAISVYASAIFLAIGQALVGLMKSADTVNAGGRILFGGLIILGLFGASGTLGGVWESISHWSPVGVVMNLFAGVITTSSWSSTDTLALIVGAGYTAVCFAIGVRWFQWEAR